MKLIAVILAGGKSERAGILKGLRLFNDKYWLDEQIIRLKEIGFKEIHIGLGFGHEEYIKSCVELNHANIHINPMPEKGPFSTLKTVIKGIKSNDYKMILFHVDRPIPKKHTLKILDDTLIKDVIKLRYNNKAAHPIALSSDLAKRFLEKSDSENLRQIIRALPEDRIDYIDIDDPLTQLNLNRPEEWNLFIRNNE